VLGTVAAGGAALGGVGVVGANPGNGNGNGRDEGEDERDDDGGFPPSGITEYGRTAELGEGEVRPFTTETPSGEPKYHGVEFDRSALDGLPESEDLNPDESSETDKYRRGGQAAEVHFKRSLQFFLPFPDAAETPFTFLGLNWNPDGHYGGAGAWERPHFDIHFHMLDPATVDAVEGPKLPPYDTSNGEYTDGSPAPDPEGKVVSTNLDIEKQLPEGYSRPPEPVADQRYITDMGEHTAPDDAPELPDGEGQPGDPTAFTNTLIQGFIGVGDDDDDPQLAFVEPMVTRDYLDSLDEVQRFDVPQPEVYPHDQRHPTSYSVRDVPSKDTVVVALEAFEQV
jgi:hypothetical protein